MVYYFQSTGSEGSYASNPRFIYMGKDKMENEDLIRYGLDQDVWFHVDNLSSAHVYLRLIDGESWDSIPEELLIGMLMLNRPEIRRKAQSTNLFIHSDCCQLTKANSIEGNKRDNITVIYTPWTNLKKTKGMSDGEVGFKNSKKVKKFHVQTRDNSINNRLKKTREEIKGKEHLIEAKNNRDKDLIQKRLQLEREQKAREAEEKKQHAEEKYRRETMYDDMWDDDEAEKNSNQRRMYDPEEDFW